MPNQLIPEKTLFSAFLIAEKCDLVNFPQVTFFRKVGFFKVTYIRKRGASENLTNEDKKFSIFWIIEKIF